MPLANRKDNKRCTRDNAKYAKVNLRYTSCAVIHQTSLTKQSKTEYTFPWYCSFFQVSLALVILTSIEENTCSKSASKEDVASYSLYDHDVSRNCSSPIDDDFYVEQDVI